MIPSVTVTGTYRSGTTLVERLLDQHPDAAIASQPLPHLWLAAKRAYLAARGVDRAIPLGPLFRDPANDPEAFKSFMGDWPADPAATLSDVVASQSSYSGAMTPEVASLPSALPADLQPGLAVLVAWAYCALADAKGQSAAGLVGAKEIVIDEFVPLLLARGHHVVLVVRDVRSVVASSVHGNARNFVGEARPTLFTVRTWRRTVAMALAYRHHPRCHVLRYEDVLDDPDLVAQIWRRSGLDERSASLVDPSRLRDQYGREWSANTSFGHHSPDGARSVARAVETLDGQTLDYLTATAGPELLAFGYLDTLHPDPERALREFVEPVPVADRGVVGGLSSAPEAIADELQRLEYLRRDLDSSTAREWFIIPEVHRLLQRTVGSAGQPLV